MEDPKQRQVYLVGAGIASLASAAYLIRDGHIPGADIPILLEGSTDIGGSMDAHGSQSFQLSIGGERE